MKRPAFRAQVAVPVALMAFLVPAADLHHEWFDGLYDAGARILAMGAKEKAPNGLEMWGVRDGFSFTVNRTAELE